MSLKNYQELPLQVVLDVKEPPVRHSSQKRKLQRVQKMCHSSFFPPRVMRSFPVQEYLTGVTCPVWTCPATFLNSHPIPPSPAAIALMRSGRHHPSECSGGLPCWPGALGRWTFFPRCSRYGIVMHNVYFNMRCIYIYIYINMHGYDVFLLYYIYYIVYNIYNSILYNTYHI